MHLTFELLQRMVVPALLLLYFPAVGLLGVVIRQWKPSMAAARRLQLRFWTWAHARAEAVWHWIYYRKLKPLHERNKAALYFHAPPVLWVLPKSDERIRAMVTYPLGQQQPPESDMDHSIRKVEESIAFDRRRLDREILR